MNELRIEAERATPEVILNPAGIIRIKGRSIHENIREFFIPVEDWVSNYVKEPSELTSVEINLEYFNSATAKALLNIFQHLLKVQLKHKKLVINWFYEEGDEDIREKGEYFSSVLKMPFNFRKTP